MFGCDLIEVSQEVDPLDVIYIAIGLKRVWGAFFVSFRASVSSFEMKVFVN
jgi:hypothetical protein